MIGKVFDADPSQLLTLIAAKTVMVKYADHTRQLSM